MKGEQQMELTTRQRNEMEYHKEHARKNMTLVDKPVDWEVIENPGKRWWNAYWQMFDYLAGVSVKGKNALVVGCGFGDDALRLAAMGANVSACDLSADSLELARKLADREGVDIALEQMKAESMTYTDSMFDVIVARDIFHHVEIGPTMREIERVSRPGAVLVVNEIYTHSWIDWIRHSSLVERLLYARMQRFVYASDDPYITEDERKLDESDVAAIMETFTVVDLRRYFNFVVTRVLPDRYDTAAKVDRAMLLLLGPLGHMVAGRILFGGRLKTETE